jgi:RNA polymerase sigma-70 factor (ECF subfamily)
VSEQDHHQQGPRDCAETASLLRKGWFWHSPSLWIMIRNGQEEVRAALADQLMRLWRYGLVLSGRRDTAEDLVQATCLRALERALQFEPGTRLDRWLFSILHSIWLNEIRARRVRQGEGLVDAETSLAFDGAGQVEANVLVSQVLREVQALPEPQREAVFLVYVEGMAYREAAEVLHVPIGTIMSRLAAARVTLGKLAEGGSRRKDVPKVRHP